MSTRRLILLASILLASLTVALVPTIGGASGGGGGGQDKDNNQFNGVVKQGGAPTSSLTVTGCASTGPGATGNGTVSGVTFRTESAHGNSGKVSLPIRVYREGADTGVTITEHEVDSAPISYTIPCSKVGNGSEEISFVPSGGSKKDVDVVVTYGQPPSQ